MWEKWGLRDNPYSQDPIGKNNLKLFVARKKEITYCFNNLSSSNVRIVIEGRRGVGTTSQLARELKKNQTAISRSLRELLDKSIIVRKKEGRNSFYSATPDAKVAYIK